MVTLPSWSHIGLTACMIDNPLANGCLDMTEMLLKAYFIKATKVDIFFRKTII